ncbi:helix-turn-helix domain-containing protein [Paenibacillus sonchi]|uniref:helix-turn-helix domain-containing protein n=1 Tax=Paenibacillus sonchi TaxID=373687 RepID=UPI001E646D66|nr:helix-turn-helix transcriptional regulator [Paenibacillus sonchi]MCE3198239.1 helix-turn-helix domain-containing protein [Paenibacillus sonchi]
MISSEQVGKRIARLRKEKHMSQEQLAEQLNVSAQAVSKWETGKSLPETSSLPLLSSLLGHSIDSILLPQKLVVLSAVYTDGQAAYDVTHFVNQLIVGNRLNLVVNKLTFPESIKSDRLKLLLLKYETPSGVYATYVFNDDLLTIDLHSTGYASSPSELDIVFAAYGNEQANRNVLNKIKHYEFFQWKQLTASHKLFPSLIDNNGNDYLLLLYLNEEGIHAVSCAEGEQIHYTPDRTRLFRTESPHEHCIVEGVGRLGFGRGMDCSWAGALLLSLTASGVDTTYEQIMGVSGACWRIAFTAMWDYSSTDALVAYNYSDPAFNAYGLTPIWANNLNPEERRLEKHNILESIRNHQLPIAINLRVASEWGVITGYLDAGGTLLCRSYFDDETFEKLRNDPEFLEYMKVSKGYLNVDNWPYMLVRIGNQENIPSALDNLYASFRIKVDSMNTAGNGGYNLGYKAFEAWQEGLLDDAWYRNASDKDFARRLGVNHFCMMGLTDARRSAAVYLQESLPLLVDRPGYPALSELAELYAQIAALLAGYYNCMTDPASVKSDISRQLWTREQREQQAKLLQTVAALELRGEALAQAVLEH